MKKLNHLIAFAIALFFLPFLQSCNDDDSGNEPATMTYPHTIAFSHFENIDFKMWTNGAEVNTTGLNFIDFVEDGEANSLLIPEYHESGIGLTFTEDSVFALLPNGVIESAAYLISNDSIFARAEYTSPVDTVGYVFLGLGTPFHLSLVQGFAQYCDTDSDMNMLTCLSSVNEKFQTLPMALEEFEIPSVDYIEEGDTLFFNNRIVHYK